jgi:hypothetical protein
VLSEEVASAHWVPLEALSTTTVDVADYPEPVSGYVLDVAPGPLVVWGITYGILELLRDAG